VLRWPFLDPEVPVFWKTAETIRVWGSVFEVWRLGDWLGQCVGNDLQGRTCCCYVSHLPGHSGGWHYWESGGERKSGQVPGISSRLCTRQQQHFSVYPKKHWETCATQFFSGFQTYL